MKFLAWFFAVIVFFSSFFVVFTYNLHQSFLTPEKTKQVLVKVDFYNQMRSVIKKDLFESGGENSEQVKAASKVINSTLDQFDFQPKIERLITDFYSGLNQKGGFALTIDLSDFKTIFAANALGQMDKASAKELLTSIPDSWKVDMTPYSSSFASIAFMYHNYNLILIIYGISVLLFLLFCILVSFKYLRLFFGVFLIVGFLLLVQLVLWKVVNLSSFLANLESQGRTGLTIMAENFLAYLRSESIRLLFWESILIFVPSLIAIIIISLIPSKVNNVPLHETKS